MARIHPFLGLSVLVLASGCGSKEPAIPAGPPPATEAAPAEPAPAPPTPEPEAAPARDRKPFEVYSHCSDVVTLAFAEDPKAPNTGRRTLAPSSSLLAPRDKDGSQTVWLLDANGEPLIKVHVTRGMKRVEIGKSCRTLDAR